jgi:membrane-associated phospholipid phosphatase
MDPVFEWGINVIQDLQAFFGSSGVDLARVFTFLGNQEFYLLLFPFLLWCVDWAIGMRLTILYLLSVAVNTDVKDVIQQARPYTLEAGINLVEPDAAYIYGEGYGMPSGHAQLSATVWGVMALWMRKPWFWVLALFMPLAVGLSRLILGMHFPTQILAGWGVGIVVVGLYVLLTVPVEHWLRQLTLGQQLVLAAAIPLIILFIHPVPDNLAAMATLFGVGIGLVLCYHYVPYSVSGSWQRRLSRYVLGIIVLLILYLGLSVVFPDEGESLYNLFRFIRYTLMGLWISLGAPWVFSRTHLALPMVKPA